MNFSKHFQKGDLVPFLALVIIVATSAFKANFANQTFYYHGSTFDQATVEVESNWSVNPIPSAVLECGLASVITCSIILPEGYRNPNNDQLDGSKAMIIANSQPNTSDPTTVNDVKSTAAGNHARAG